MTKMTMRAARVNAGLTQTDVAERMQVSRQSVFDWENGNTKIKPVFFHYFCELVGLTEDDVLLPEKSIKSRP